MECIPMSILHKPFTVHRKHHHHHHHHVSIHSLVLLMSSSTSQQIACPIDFMVVVLVVPSLPSHLLTRVRAPPGGPLTPNSDDAADDAGDGQVNMYTRLYIFKGCRRECTC